MITARGGTDLIPAYGVGSLARHLEQGAVEIKIPAASGLRRDIDVQEDLTVNDFLGPCTRAFIEEHLASELAGELQSGHDRLRAIPSHADTRDRRSGAQ